MVMHAGYDPLNPQTGTFREVVDDKGFLLFLEDLEMNVRVENFEENTGTD